ncbi:MAG: BatD family protein [Elusimicrobia bacterium]|nr:BatD family protein [Elusimicrobiota bacterium]
MKTSTPNNFRSGRRVIVFTALCFCAFAPLSLYAEFSISAEVDKKTVEINDSLYLTVTVSADSASVPEPKLPRMTNFNVYSSGRSQNISIVNGKITTSVSFTYVLSPMFIGRQKIPSFSIFNGKEKALTREIDVMVVRSAAAQAPSARQAPAPRAGRPAARAAEVKPGDLLYLTAETDKRTAYPNEQINLTVKFYTAVPLTSNPQYLPPQFKNLIAEDLPPVRNGETVIKGTRYAYSEIKTAVFGLEEGRAQVNPATVIAQLHRDTVMDPFDPNFFQKFLSMNSRQGAKREVKSNALTLTLLPFPPGAPASFKGAAGSFAISAELDRKEIKTGEALNLSVKISGNGNLKVLTAPKLPDMPEFKVYDTMSSLDISKENDVIGGKKVFTTILIPKSAGSRTIPPVQFSFFDPAAKVYREIASKPFEITVLKGDGAGTNVSFAHGGQVGITPLASDIRYVSEKASPPPSAALARSISALPLWLNLIPAFIALLSFWVERMQAFRIRNPLLFRFKKAGSKAVAGLQSAREKLKSGHPAEAASILYDSLLEYLSDKSGQKVSGLTRKKTFSLLKEKFPGAGDYAMGEIGDLWENLEALHFTPDGDQPGRAKEMIEKYSVLLDMLETEFRK